MNVKAISWFSTLHSFALRFRDFNFLLSRFSAYKKAHPKIKSVNRIAFYVLKTNCSTTVMYLMRYVVATCMDDYIDFRKEIEKVRK